jgi:hypothetical protein
MAPRYVVVTLKENITLLNGDGDITIGNVFIARAKQADSMNVIVEVVGLIVGRRVIMFNNVVNVSLPNQFILALQTDISAEWLEPFKLKNEVGAAETEKGA